MEFAVAPPIGFVARNPRCFDVRRWRVTICGRGRILETCGPQLEYIRGDPEIISLSFRSGPTDCLSVHSEPLLTVHRASFSPFSFWGASDPVLLRLRPIPLPFPTRTPDSPQNCGQAVLAPTPPPLFTAGEINYEAEHLLTDHHGSHGHGVAGGVSAWEFRPGAEAAPGDHA